MIPRVSDANHSGVLPGRLILGGKRNLVDPETNGLFSYARWRDRLKSLSLSPKEADNIIGNEHQ